MSSRAQQKRFRCTPISIVLPRKFRADLTDARVTRAANQSESAATYVAVRVIKLRMVEDVKELSAQLEIHRLRNPSDLRQAKIRVDNSGAMEEPLVRCAEGSKNIVDAKSVR